MNKVTKVNCEGEDYGFVAGNALKGVSGASASDYVKTVVLSEGADLVEGCLLLVTFANGNTAGFYGTKTVYSSNGTTFYYDQAMTQPVTLPPAGCYTITPASGNEYLYQAFPVLSVNGVEAPFCDSKGHPYGGAAWSAGDSVTMLYMGDKFVAILSTINQVVAGVDIPPTSDAVYQAIAGAVNGLDVASVGGSGKYISAISETNGKISATASNLATMVESGNNQPVTSSGVAGAIQNMTDIASSLPTDAVLHYSFDDVPDYPDGTADVRLLDNNTYNIQNGDWKLHNNGSTTFANVNGNIVATISSGNRSNGFYIAYNNQLKIIKMKIKVTSIVGGLRVLNGAGEDRIDTITKNGEFVYCMLTNTTVQYKNIYVVADNSGSSATVEIEQIYIGDGSYSTPIIDNANGQNNATNNGGIAVQGVCGKGVRFLGNGYINGTLPWTPWDKQIFSISCWIRNWDKNSLYLINNWITYGISTLYVYFNQAVSGNRIIIDVCVGNDLYRFRNTSFDFTNINEMFVVCILNGTATKLYINGNLVNLYGNRVGVWGESTKNRQNFQIGRARGDSNYNYSKADIDDLLIFDRALSDTEVQALYQNKANTPKYFPTPTNEIKEGSLELATSGGVADAIELANIDLLQHSSTLEINAPASTSNLAYDLGEYTPSQDTDVTISWWQENSLTSNTRNTLRLENTTDNTNSYYNSSVNASLTRGMYTWNVTLKANKRYRLHYWIHTLSNDCTYNNFKVSPRA